MAEDGIQNIVEFLKELKDDTGVPKNVKGCIVEVIGILQSNLEKSIKIDKVMSLFDELHDDSNIDSFTRTQLWNVVSMLEEV